MLIHGAIVPAIATAMYIYIYPFLSKPVYEHSLKKQQELRRIKQEEENNRLLSIEESRALYKKVGMLEIQIDKDTEDYRNQIKSLTETINLLEEQQTITKSFSDDDINDNLFNENDSQIKNKIQSSPEDDFRNIAVKKKGTENQVISTKTKEPVNEPLKEIQELKTKRQDAKSKNNTNLDDTEFLELLNSGKVDGFLSQKDLLLTSASIPILEVNNAAEAVAFGLVVHVGIKGATLSEKGKKFLKWDILREREQE